MVKKGRYTVWLLNGGQSKRVDTPTAPPPPTLDVLPEFRACLGDTLEHLTSNCRGWHIWIRRCWAERETATVSCVSCSLCVSVCMHTTLSRWYCGMSQELTLKRGWIEHIRAGGVGGGVGDQFFSQLSPCFLFQERIFPFKPQESLGAFLAEKWKKKPFCHQKWEAVFIHLYHVDSDAQQLFAEVKINTF